jgi:hypothetical protein
MSGSATQALLVHSRGAGQNLKLSGLQTSKPKFEEHDIEQQFTATVELIIL